MGADITNLCHQFMFVTDSHVLHVQSTRRRNESSEGGQCGTDHRLQIQCAGIAFASRGECCVKVILVLLLFNLCLIFPFFFYIPSKNFSLLKMCVCVFLCMCISVHTCILAYILSVVGVLCQISN